MSLEGFKIYVPTTGDTNLTLTKNGIGISKATVSKLSCSKYVKVLIDYQGHRMAIVETDENDPAKTEFARNGRNSGLRWNSRDLVKTLCQMNDWHLDNGKNTRSPVNTPSRTVQ